MLHKFDIRHINKLDNPERRKQMPPKETLLKLGLKEGNKFADIGCGIGYFSISAVDIVGNAGLVYCIDESEKMLEELKNRLKSENAKILKAETRKVPIDEQIVDFVLLSNVLHEIKNPRDMIKEVKRILNSNGKVAIIEWKKKETLHGPPIDSRIDEAFLKNILMEDGFKNIETIDLTQNHYALVAKF